MKREILSATGATVVIIILAVLLSEGVIALSDVSSALAYVLVGTILGILVWGFEPRIKRIVKRKSHVLTTIEPRFAHLTIHYSQITDTPDTPNPARPRYVANTTTNEAYWVSDLLEPYIRQRKISWHAHDGSEALKTHFKKNRIHPNEHDPKPEDLGLSLSRDGSLQSPDPNFVELLSKLEGKKLDNLRILKLFPWYSYFSTSGYTSKRLLLKHSTNETFDSPLHDLELAEKGIIDSENYTMKPFESLEAWSKRHKYRYIRKRYTEGELLGG